MNGEQSQGDKNGTFPALRKLRAENQGTEIASELASILGMVDYGELSAHSAEGAPDRETEAMVDAARGIMQILRGKPGCTEQDVFRHCKLAGYSTEGLHEHDGSYVTEARAAAMIWRAMMRVAPRSHERTPADYAIEHGEHLAVAAEGFLKAVDRFEELDNPDSMIVDLDALNVAEETRSDHHHVLEVAIYEFRKRAARAKAPASAKPRSDA